MNKSCIDKRTKEIRKEELKEFAKAGVVGLTCMVLILLGFVLLGDWMWIAIYAAIPISVIGIFIYVWLKMTRATAEWECKKREIEAECEQKIKEMYQRKE